MKRRVLGILTQGIEDGLGGINDDRTEFNIAMTNVSGVSGFRDPQEILEVSLALKLEQDPETSDDFPQGGYKRQTRNSSAMSGFYLTGEERQSAMALLRTRLANLSQEIPADTSGMRSYLGYSIPEQISHFVAREGGNPWTRSSHRADASNLVDGDTENSSESDDDATNPSSLVKAGTETSSASHDDIVSQAGESSSA
ncbi:hypothetical protein EHS25_002335 [Saitozyma podzolica]|uniref:Uncharacterized protein n=1 Tax=Saitozyma podzolica TaxID=1890683 RepID=A0A427YDT9_9TREE|nr:hypothetical protein EHS25_002335 [Saitozyma podzolica]